MYPLPDLAHLFRAAPRGRRRDAVSEGVVEWCSGAGRGSGEAGAGDRGRVAIGGDFAEEGIGSDADDVDDFFASTLACAACSYAIQCFLSQTSVAPTIPDAVLPCQCESKTSFLADDTMPIRSHGGRHTRI